MLPFSIVSKFHDRKFVLQESISFLFDSPDIHLVVNRYFVKFDLGTWFGVRKVKKTECSFSTAEARTGWVRIWNVLSSNFSCYRWQPIYINGLGLMLNVCMRCTCELTPSKLSGHFFGFHAQSARIWYEFHSSEERF